MYFRKTFRNDPLFARIRNETTLPVWMTGVENYFDRIYLFLRLQNMITGENLGVLVISLDETFISAMFGKALTDGDAEIFLTNGTGQVISSWPETVRGLVYSTSSVRKSPWLEHSLSLHQNWTLIMRQSLFSILSGTRALGLVIGISSIMLVLLSLLGSFYLTNHFSKPIFSLLSAMKQVEAGQFVQITDSRKDEFAQLYAGYNAMADQLGVLFRDLNASLEEISRHKREMEEYNESLEKTVRERTDILLQSEKMAALGSLVAGVAHEINTPLGLGITSVSYQDENLDAILGQFESNTLTKSSLERFLASCREANSIALTNLRRAAELVSSFKRIAVDQTSEDLREFNLKDCLHDTLVSLGPRLSRCRQTVDVVCPDDIRIRNSPGAFYQIVSNLVLNAVIHAWDSPDEQGTITVSAALESDTLVLTVTDDGQGMDEQTCGRIFDPFFTTKHESGGSGLGLYVVYNLVDQQLRGRITCTSRPGKGTCFRIRCPART
jgi:signal transduction histidine kinase